MEDREIIKALEICIDFVSGGEVMCNDCPLYDCENCSSEKLKQALDLINRQKAKIERLEKARQKQAQFLGEERGQKYELINKITKAKSEAVKEFAEMFNSLLSDFDDYNTLHIYEIKDRIDILKEMVGDE